MGKPLNIYNLAKNLGIIKSKINPNYHFKHKVVGLQPGEKLHETIVDKKESVKKYSNEILLIKNKYNKRNKFLKLFNNLVSNYKNKKKTFSVFVKYKKI